MALFISWACAALRAALNTVERTWVEDAAQAGHVRAAALLHLLDNPPRSLFPLHVLNSAALVTLAGAALGQILANGVTPDLLAVSLVELLFVWLVGRLAATWLGAWRARTLAEASAPILALLVTVAQPFLAFEAWIVRQARGTPHLTERVTTDDIQIIVTEGNQERKLEEIEPEEREMIAGIIEMSERTARDLMIPRLDVNAIELNAPLDDALDMAIQYGHSRLPVYEGDIDHIVGILHVKDLIQRLRHPERILTLRDLLRRVHFVPDVARAHDLLRDLLRNRVHMAVVVDEYGGTVGLVTIEDALEEIVGEIRDEYDAAEEPEFVRVNADEAVFNARVPIAEVNDAIEIHLPTEESDTLGGLVYALLGRMPRVGDHVEVGAVDLQVTAVTGRRIKQVRVVKLHPQEKGEGVAE
ncbi:MAG: hemolysin family protein [Anaerolineae bacterium]